MVVKSTVTMSNNYYVRVLFRVLEINEQINFNSEPEEKKYNECLQQYTGDITAIH